MNTGLPYSILVLNQSWFVSELRALGHKVVYASWLDNNADINFVTPGLHINELLSRLPAGFKPDCVVYFDNSGPAALIGIEDSPYPTIFYSVDAHHHVHWQAQYALAFDRILVAQKDFVDDFIASNAESYWFPLWAHEHLASREPKTIDVSFRGNLNSKLHPRRAAFFEALQLLTTVDTLTAPYEDIYSVSRIVVNQTVKGDLNFRVFEAMACGAMLLTPDINNGLRELFTPGEDIVVYRENDADDAAEKIRYYLEHEEERKQIAMAGYRKVNERHRASSRAAQLIQHISQTEVSSRKKKRYGAAVAYLTASGICKSHLPPLSDLLLLAASMSIGASISEKEPVSLEKLYCVGHDCRFRLEKNGQLEKSQELAIKLYERDIDEPLNRLALIDMLAQSGRLSEAYALCEPFKQDPMIVVSKARIAMQQFADDLESSSRKAD